MAEIKAYSIRKLLEQIDSGQIRIPVFQRGFIWDADHVAKLLDSIYKGYPFGSLLFWLTSERLIAERALGPFELPEPTKKHPVYYVLDGQQRVTSLFVTFQTERQLPDDPEWRSVYFDVLAKEDMQQSQFVALANDEIDSSRHFPLSTLFDPVKYRESTKMFAEEDQIRSLDRLYTVFKEATVPVQVMETEDRATVAVVFERINRQGVSLTTLELLSAWTWSEDFDLRSKLEVLQEELEDFAFGDIAEEPDLVLRCAAAILHQSSDVESLVKISGDEIRSQFPAVLNGIKGAIDFLRSQLKVRTLRVLPYPLMLVPLSVFFAVGDEKMLQPTEKQVASIKRWFWRSCFSERYSGQSVRSANADIVAMLTLRDDENSSTLGDFAVGIFPTWFLTNFRMGSAKTATFVNMLAQYGPRSFISGNTVDVGDVLQKYNKAEFHHIYPKAYLEGLGEETPKHLSGALVNFCFLSRVDNNKIRAKAPSIYRSLMPDSEAVLKDILHRSLVPYNVFADDYSEFIVHRIEILMGAANGLCDPVSGNVSHDD